MKNDTLVKKVLNWTEKEMENIDENTKHPILKAFGLGAIEGAIDGAVLAYPILVGGMFFIRAALKKNVE